jgi:hypothetical protein
MPFVTVEVCEKNPFRNECWFQSTKLVSLSLSSFMPLKSVFCCTTCTGEEISYYGLLPAWIAVIGTIILLAIFAAAMIWQRGRIPKAVICMMVGISTLVTTLIIHETPIPYISSFLPYGVTPKWFLVLSVNFNIAFEILLAVAVGIILVGVLEMAQRPRRLFGVKALIPYVPEEREREQEEPSRRLRGARLAWPKLRLPRLSLKRPERLRRDREREEPYPMPPVETESPPPPQSDREAETETAGNEWEDVETTQEASAPTRLMVCRKCGRQLRQGARFCPVCRTRVEVPQSEVQPREETPAGGSEAQARAGRDTLADRFMGTMSRLVQGPLNEDERGVVGESGHREGPELVSAYGFKRWRIAGLRYDNPFLNWGLLIVGAIMFLVGVTQGLTGG